MKIVIYIIQVKILLHMKYEKQEIELIVEKSSLYCPFALMKNRYQAKNKELFLFQINILLV